MATAQEMFTQIASVLKGLSLVQKVAGAAVLFVVVGGLLTLTMTTSSKTDYAVLFSGLSQEDAAEVVARLKEQMVPYQLSENGAAILVAPEKVHEIRLTLAGDGLPRGGGVGFEIFDKSSFGTTDFVQKLNYQRALQGELARTITNFQQVKEARVHIAASKESVFVEDEKPTTASISVRLRGNEKLSKGQIQAIVHLVASAVPGLKPESITMVDTNGRLLFRGGANEEAVLSDSQLEYQLKVENSLRTKIETLFSEAVGEGLAMARVTAEVDFSRVDVTEEEFDPEGQVVRSEQLNNEEDLKSKTNPEGIPGVKGNLATYADEQGGSGNSGDNFKRNNVTRNYEISRKTKHVQDTGGITKRVSVAVMVDGTYEKVVDKDGKSSLKYTPRTDEEMQRFEKMAKNAIGFNEERGDTVEVINMSFAVSRVPTEEEGGPAKWRELMERASMPVVYFLIVLGILLFVIRPLIKLLTERQLEEQRSLMAAEQSDQEKERAKEEEDLTLQPMSMTDKEKIYKLAQSDPDRAADLVRRWLREEQ